jgi:LacI family transcriptional regulator, galactose operon repressor
MARRPTIRDVAREARVSTVTVSRVANAPELVKPETRARVETATRELGYLPNAAAQSMRTNVSRTIGFLVPDLTNYPNAAVAKAAEARLAEAGYYMLLTDSDQDVVREERFLRLLRSRQVDGIILYLSDEDDPAVQATIAELDIPVVVLDRDLPFPIDTVFSEHATAMHETVGHLVARGHRELGLLLPALRIRPVRERVRAFREAVRALGLDPARQVVVEADPLRGGPQAVRALLAGPTRPSALLIDGTRLLAAAFEGLHGLDPTQRVTPIAIDVVEPLAAAMPEIVGIARDFAAIGREAARLMIDRLSGALSGPPQRITLASRAVMATPAPLPAALAANS